MNADLGSYLNVCMSNGDGALNVTASTLNVNGGDADAIVAIGRYHSNNGDTVGGGTGHANLSSNAVLALSAARLGVERWASRFHGHADRR